jgi:hypothetical protein
VSAFIFLLPVMNFRLFVNIFTRTGVPSGLGGLGITGLLHMPFEFNFLNFLQVNSIIIFKSIFIFQIVIATFSAVICALKPKLEVFIVSSVLLMSSILLTSPVTNPQYILWLLPFLMLGASGVFENGKTFKATIIATTFGSLVYLWGLFGFTDFFSESSIFFGFPKPSTVLSEWKFLRTPLNNSWLPINWDDRLGVVGAVCVTGGLIYMIFSLAQHHFSSRMQDQIKPQYLKTYRRSFTHVLIACSVSLFAIIEITGVYGPALIKMPVVNVSNSPSNSTSQVNTYSISGSPGTKVASFSVNTFKGIKYIYIFNDNKYPTVGGVPNQSLGFAQDFIDVLSGSLKKYSISLVDAKELSVILKTPKTIIDSLVIDVSGVLPDTVYTSAGGGEIVNWISKGGRLVFAGAPPGFYSATTNSASLITVSKNNLSRSLFLGTNWASPQGIHNSKWSSVLGTQFSEIQFGLSVQDVKNVQGVILGKTNYGLTSEAFIPYGKGGILAFGGAVINSQDLEYLIFDVARFVESNWFSYDGGGFSGLNLTSDSNNSIVRFSTGDKQVQFFAFNNYLPLWAWTKEFTNG